MRKKILIGLSVLAAVFCTLYSCIQEDFANKEAASERNAAEFFKHAKTHGAHARAGIDYVDILETYNRENNFLAQMSDQQGMPIWEKMQVFDAGTATALIIPLSDDNKVLSSLLFATLDSRNQVAGVRNFDNAMLREIVYNETLNRDYREYLLSAFMMADHHTFGTTHFTNIPKDLFIKQKYNDELGRISIKDISFSNVTANENGRIIIIESCYIVLHCTHHGTGSCDAINGCTDCGTEYCTYSVAVTSDGIPFPPTNTSPGGISNPGTGGGGPGLPAVIPDPDPCGLSKAFYRLAPNCNGNPEPPEPIENPCEKLKLDLQKAKQMMDNNIVKAQNDVMTATILSDTYEKGMYWGQNSSGQMMTSNIINMSLNYGGIPISSAQFTPTGSAHNHNGPNLYTNFSPADITGFNATNQNFPTINHTFANGADGSLYVITIEDQLAYNDYVTQYPMSTIDAPSQTNPNGSGDWIIGTNIRTEEDLVLDYFRKQGIPEDEVYDLTLGYLSNAYNMGIVISKKGTDGKFHPIQVEKVEVTNPFTGEKLISYQKINPCNL